MDRSDCTTANDQADEAHVEDYLNTNPDAQAGSASTSEKQCRICFSGPEEEDALGRLISPCMCAGSMRYVHVSCINAWRGTGANAKAFMECPQCHFRYQIRRQPRSLILRCQTDLARRHTYFWSGHLYANLAIIHVLSVLDSFSHPRFHPTLSSCIFYYLSHITVLPLAHQCRHTFRSFWRRVY